jgi:hypothetical protein
MLKHLFQFLNISYFQKIDEFLRFLAKLDFKEQIEAF